MLATREDRARLHRMRNIVLAIAKPVPVRVRGFKIRFLLDG
jgi:hypothetical protein